MVESKEGTTINGKNFLRYHANKVCNENGSRQNSRSQGIVSSSEINTNKNQWITEVVTSKHLLYIHQKVCKPGTLKSKHVLRLRGHCFKAAYIVWR